MFLKYFFIYSALRAELFMYRIIYIYIQKYHDVKNNSPPKYIYVSRRKHSI